MAKPAVLVLLLTLAGGALLSLGHFGGFDGQLSGLLSSLGGAILSGGVFMAVAKSIQLSGIFKEEISKAMAEWQEQGGSAEDHWQRHTVTLCNFLPHAEELASGMLAAIKDKQGAYYDDCRFEYYVQSFDHQSGIIEIHETAEFTIKVKDKATRIPVKFTWSEQLHAQQEMIVDSLHIDGEKVEPSVNRAEVKGRTTLQYDNELQGKTQYAVRRKSKRKCSIYVENWIRVGVTRHTTGARATVRGKLDGLKVTLLPIVTSGDFVPLPDASDGDLGWEYKKPMTPQQGFVIHFVPAKTPSSSGRKTGRHTRAS